MNERTNKGEAGAAGPTLTKGECGACKRLGVGPTTVTWLENTGPTAAPGSGAGRAALVRFHINAENALIMVLISLELIW